MHYVYLNFAVSHKLNGLTLLLKNIGTNAHSRSVFKSCTYGYGTKAICFVWTSILDIVGP